MALQQTKAILTTLFDILIKDPKSLFAMEDSTAAEISEIAKALLERSERLVSLPRRPSGADGIVVFCHTNTGVWCSSEQAKTMQQLEKEYTQLDGMGEPERSINAYNAASDYRKHLIESQPHIKLLALMTGDFG